MALRIEGMSKNKAITDGKRLPRYRGGQWIEPDLPDEAQDWLLGKADSVGKDVSHRKTLKQEMRKAVGAGRWKWPKRPICFVTDLHADRDALHASLVAAGVVKRTGSKAGSYKLTGFGRKSRLLVGGDCFDKGPSTLDLLSDIRRLRKRGANLRLLAGNHDMRMLIGIRSVGLERDPHTEHFFVRMGPKVVPFMGEVYARYLGKASDLRGIPGERTCRRRLYPSSRWFEEFPLLASWVMPDQAVEREVSRMRKKLERFEGDCEAAGMSMRMVYAAARKWQELFLHRQGKYAWFFRDMQLARREGSFLFIHAGLDDRTARMIGTRGVGDLNRLFHSQIQRDFFGFYYGPVANAIRTKYRDTDMPLTRHGVARVRERGIQAIVHGHSNRLSGQRIMLRKGMIHFECDTTLDRNSRRKEGLKGYGAAACIFRPEGYALGISSDYPYIKIFDPKTFAGRLP
jgi:hypothetical protein